MFKKKTGLWNGEVKAIWNGFPVAAAGEEFFELRDYSLKAKTVESLGSALFVRRLKEIFYIRHFCLT